VLVVVVQPCQSGCEHPIPFVRLNRLIFTGIHSFQAELLRFDLVCSYALVRGRFSLECHADESLEVMIHTECLVVVQCVFIEPCLRFVPENLSVRAISERKCRMSGHGVGTVELLVAALGKRITARNAELQTFNHFVVQGCAAAEVISDDLAVLIPDVGRRVETECIRIGNFFVHEFIDECIVDRSETQRTDRAESPYRVKKI